MDPRHRSRIVTDGTARAPARAMLRAVGFDDEDFTRPQIGVVAAANDLMPCNGYGAPASDIDSLVGGYGDDPRGWAGFETFCQVYELWATAWALSQPDPDVVAEGVVRAAALSGTSGRPWQLR